MKEKIQCPHCNKYFSKYGIKNHIFFSHTEEGKIEKEKRKIKSSEQSLKYIEKRCKFCNKIIKGTHGYYRSHLGNCKFKPNYKEQIENISKHRKCELGKASTLEKEELRKQRISEAMKKVKSKPDAIIKGGRCKWYMFEGVNLQGTWELRFAKLCQTSNIKWEKNQKYIYIYNKKNDIHYYRPDFYLPEIDIYIELKGYWWGDDKNKMKLIFEQNKNHKIKIIRKRQLEDLELLIENKLDKNKIFNYIINNSYKF